ncbi:head-tail connector protein [Pectinatus frisingensis]|uniref:head-tail connector protein n=1 Tax=Pectinatus frisingensis TaxID=865 RepID=UPI0018C731B4|nr:head-tail connector protein [Pectinatus frisingensis]
MDLNYVKNYLRIDADLTDDDALIQGLTDAAQEYIQNQTGKQYNDDKVWNVCICLLVSHWYDNRQLNPAKTGTLDEYPHSVTALITHIGLSTVYPVMVTS